MTQAEATSAPNAVHIETIHEARTECVYLAMTRASEGPYTRARYELNVRPQEPTNFLMVETGSVKRHQILLSFGAGGIAEVACLTVPDGMAIATARMTANGAGRPCGAWNAVALQVTSVRPFRAVVKVGADQMELTLPEDFELVSPALLVGSTCDSRTNIIVDDVAGYLER